MKGFKADYTGEHWQAMSGWYETALGADLLGKERALIAELTQRRFGYHLLQLGCSELVLNDLSPIGHKFSFCPFPHPGTAHTAVARGEAIPLPTESVDMVLLHHALDFSRHQHQLLREVSRVLIAGGAIVIVGFNPFSCWGIRKSLQWLRRNRSPWNASMLSAHRISDWLKLLDFQVDQVRYAAYSLPVKSPRLIRWSGWMEPIARRLNWPSGGVYAILARKQVVPLTPIQKSWRKLTVPGIGLPVADNIGQSMHTEPCEQD